MRAVAFGASAALVWLCQAAPALETPPPAAAPAPAAPGRPAGPVVLLWPEAGSTASASLEDALVVALAPRVSPVDRSSQVTGSRALGDRERADAEDLGRVEAGLGLARKAYLAFDFDGARAAIERLLAEDLEVLSRPGQTPLLGEALRLAGEIDLAAGRTELARARAGTAAFVLAEGAGRGVPPEYARIESDARGEAQRAARRPLRVTSEPPGATVEVDGHGGGSTPITVDVPPGAHVLRLEMSGRKVAAAIVTVAAEGGSYEAAVDPDPDDAVLLRRIGRGALDPDDEASRRALLARDGATHLVTYRATFGGVRASVRPLAADRPAVVIEGSSAAAVAGRIADAVLGLPPAPRGTGPGPALARDPPAGDAGAFYTRWWFWTSAAVMVAGAATAALLIANRPEQHAIVRPKP